MQHHHLFLTTCACIFPWNTCLLLYAIPICVAGCTKCIKLCHRLSGFIFVSVHSCLTTTLIIIMKFSLLQLTFYLSPYKGRTKKSTHLFLPSTYTVIFQLNSVYKVTVRYNGFTWTEAVTWCITNRHVMHAKNIYTTNGKQSWGKILTHERVCTVQLENWTMDGYWWL